MDGIPATPDKRVSSDGLSVAIRTILDQDASWLSVNNRGIATYLTDVQVADWTVVG